MSTESPSIFLIHSFKGGSGKTIFSSNLANVLSKAGKRVLIIETDFIMPALQSVFTEYNPDIFLNDFLKNNETDLTKYIYPDTGSNLGVIFCDERYDPSHKVHGRDQNWFRTKKEQLSSALKNLDSYDYVIFDTTPGITLFAINVLVITDVVFLLMRTDGQSIRGTKNLIERIYRKSVNLGGNINFNLILNQIPQVEAMEEVISSITVNFKQLYSFIQNIEIIDYNHKTAYYTSVDQFLLPNDDPTVQKIGEIAEGIGLMD